MSKSRFTPQERLKIVKEYLDGNTSYIKLGRKYRIDESCIRQWIAKYKAFGENAFELGSNNERYTAGFKQQVAEAYLRGEGSYRDISVAFKIHSDSTVLQWVSQYNNHIKLTDSRPEGVTDMVKIKGRKTTFEERIDIVEDCIKKRLPLF